jgi:hypothetical protein
MTNRRQDLDNKELTFLGDNRPAKRYLYFRFISSIIHAQKTGNVDILGRLEVKKIWASPGEYLRRSTLVMMARQISGFELPPAAYQEMTFVEDGEEETKSQETATVLSAQLREAIIESARSEETDDESSDVSE